MTLIVILDGASERPGAGPTSLERARTPALDILSGSGLVARVATTPAGLPPGSETAIPTILGAPPSATPDRGLLEAAAAGVRVSEGQWAWRVDLPRGRPFTGELAAAARQAGLRHLGGHRFLAVGHHPPELGEPWRLWPPGAPLPTVLDERTVLVGASGAAVGCARALGARAVRPPGTTGRPDSDLGAKSRAALRLAGETETTVVHVGGPDEAAHEGDREAKVAAIESADASIIAPLIRSLPEERPLAVLPDHGTDPATGAHLPDPVPACIRAPGVQPGTERLTERTHDELTIEMLWALMGLPRRATTALGEGICEEGAP